MNSEPSIESFKKTVRTWNWEELRRALVDFDRYSNAELAVMREECERRSGTLDPTADGPKDLRCVRCEIVLTYVGKKKFHEGTKWGLLGDLGEFFVTQEKFDIYCCPRCGKVEFFVDGIGEDLRPS